MLSAVLAAADASHAAQDLGLDGHYRTHARVKHNIRVAARYTRHHRRQVVVSYGGRHAMPISDDIVDIISEAHHALTGMKLVVSFTAPPHRKPGEPLVWAVLVADKSEVQPTLM